MRTIDQLSADYERLTHEYIQAFQAEEAARIKALPQTDCNVVNAWIDACRRTEEINSERLHVRKVLLRALNLKHSR